MTRSNDESIRRYGRLPIGLVRRIVADYRQMVKGRDRVNRITDDAIANLERHCANVSGQTPRLAKDMRQHTAMHVRKIVLYRDEQLGLLEKLIEQRFGEIQAWWLGGGCRLGNPYAISGCHIGERFKSVLEPVEFYIDCDPVRRKARHD
jgi:hypothetical protein